MKNNQQLALLQHHHLFPYLSTHARISLEKHIQIMGSSNFQSFHLDNVILPLHQKTNPLVALAVSKHMLAKVIHQSDQIEWEKTCLKLETAKRPAVEKNMKNLQNLYSAADLGWIGDSTESSTLRWGGQPPPLCPCYRHSSEPQ